MIGCTAQFHRDRITEVRKAWGMNMAFRSDIFHLGCLFRPDFGLRCYGRKGQAQKRTSRENNGKAFSHRLCKLGLCDVFSEYSPFCIRLKNEGIFACHYVKSRGLL